MSPGLTPEVAMRMRRITGPESASGVDSRGGDANAKFTRARSRVRHVADGENLACASLLSRDAQARFSPSATCRTRLRARVNFAFASPPRESTPDALSGPVILRIRIATSGVNPGDIRKRQDDFGYGMPYPRVIPHSDGAGQVDQVGDGVSSDWLGRRVWCYGAQSYRQYGTAAGFTVVPEALAVPLPDGVTFEQ